MIGQSKVQPPLSQSGVQDVQIIGTRIDIGKIFLISPVPIGPVAQQKVHFSGVSDSAEGSPVICRTLPSLIPGFNCGQGPPRS